MLFNFISVSNKLSNWEDEGIRYFTKQFPKHITINFENLKSQQHPKRSTSEVISLESSTLLSKIDDTSYNIAFDKNGDQMSSKDFSQLINICIESHKKTNFLIGGSFGLSKEILKKSNRVISLSNMTFPHRLFKIMLVEQLYRALSILNNSPYHK